MMAPRCEIEDCIRADGRHWLTGPALCIPHREEWAADHEAELTPAERRAWVDRNSFTDGVETWCTWPDNFRTRARPTPEQLQAHNERTFIGWRAERVARAQKRQEEQPHFGQQRWGNRR